MIRGKIQNLLREKHAHLIHWLQIQSEPHWVFAPPSKWTTGQHVLHLLQSIKPLNRALGYPKILIRYKFGICNRPTRSYDQVVNRYREKLAAAGQVVSPFSQDMQKPSVEDKSRLLRGLREETELLCRKLDGWAESKLDRLLLPHPLMGRMTIREITMWTAYHAEHHHRILEDTYKV